MSATQELELCVHDALLRGSSRAQITAALAQAGWQKDQIAGALGAYAEVEFPVPVPTPRPYLSARDAFLYLVLFTTLYMSGYSLGDLLFELINRAFPDAMDRGMEFGFGESLRTSVATIVIAFPVFAWLSARIASELREQPIKRLSAVRRWLTYLTLFIAAVIVIGDLISLVSHLLGGELSVRFVLKILVVGGIAGSIFGWYLCDLRRDERPT